ncbi:hypothetical protein GQ42DRAFT_89370 [Ramicandelaber brevisporus]|nr:hypothetical protein GQ42DRAFT_89370 [Ramicandelaber brevisporus]
MAAKLRAVIMTLSQMTIGAGPVLARMASLATLTAAQVSTAGRSRATRTWVAVHSAGDASISSATEFYHSHLL